jgi:hypothetical protein
MRFLGPRSTDNSARVVAFRRQLVRRCDRCGGLGAEDVASAFSDDMPADFWPECLASRVWIR